MNKVRVNLQPVAVNREIGHLISQAVQKFAEENNLSYDLWYHDDPVWVIRSIKMDDPNTDTHVRRIQIAVYEFEDGLKIKIIPDCYYVDTLKRERRTINPKERQKYTYSDDLRKVLGKSKEEAISNLVVHIRKVWENFRSIAERLTLEKINPY